MNNLGTNGTGLPYLPEPAPHAQTFFRELLAHSQSYGYTPTQPLDFPAPHVRRGVRAQVLAYHPATEERKLIGVIHRAEFLPGGVPPPPASPRLRTASPGSNARSPPPPPPQMQSPLMAALDLDPSSYIAYWPRRRLQEAIYGIVIVCTVLVRHVGEAADEAAKAAGYEPGHPLAPIVWEITNENVAIKQIEWSRVHAMRGRLLEDPIKEVAAMQLIGNDHPNVLGSLEALQDQDYLWSVMPFCRGGDLFGVVTETAEIRQANEAVEGVGGMLEPVARYWFRQLLFGLHHLQSKGVCHRDLSLENILVDVNHCLIIDMGMCLRVPYHNPGGYNDEAVDVVYGTDRRLIVPKGTCGKINYMSPEIYLNQDNFDGFAVDLWSAGVILYIMVTGFPDRKSVV